MPYENLPPLTKDYPEYGPGQWGVQWADRALGFRLDTRSNVFYVDSGHALTSDFNGGTDPGAPLTTITTALTRCLANNNDFIIVRQINNAAETFPITISTSRVHLLSVYYELGKGPEIRPPGDTAGLSILADNVEVAGFEINGGNTAGCIQVSAVAQSWGLDCHHNRFAWQATTPQDGIRMTGAVDKVQYMIHDNWFGDKITRDGIRIEQNSTRSEIWNNHFRMADNAGVGINLVTLCTDIYAIHDNIFRVNGAVQGDAITCNVNSLNCMFWGNRAMDLGANPAQNPYLDLGANDWADNYAGDALIYPV